MIKSGYPLGRLQDKDFKNSATEVSSHPEIGSDSENPSKDSSTNNHGFC